jgi:hypothetical protein
MNTAACRIPELDVLTPELAISPESAEPAVPSPPPAGILPKVPSRRDIEVYEDAVIAGMPQRQVAKKHSLSQPRVHQILREMGAWMADNTPGFATGLTPEQRLRLVHYNVTKQLEHQQASLMEAWRMSCGQETIRRTMIVGGIRRTVEIERPSYGNTRYLLQAGRVSAALLKLAGWTPGMVIADAPQDSPYWQMTEEETGDESQETEEVEEQEQESDLSSFAERARNPHLTRAEMDAITAEQEAVCNELQAKLDLLQAKEREQKKTLSLGSGPLLAEGGNSPIRTPKRDERDNARREFLRGDRPVMSIREFVERKK